LLRKWGLRKGNPAAAGGHDQVKSRTSTNAIAK
jgi:hypothetical protein